MKILRALFNGESLQGAVKHDAIVDQSNPEHIIVEYEGTIHKIIYYRDNN